MSQIDLDVSLVRDEKGSKKVEYFTKLQQYHSDITICQSLLQAVDQEYLPSGIFSVFLSWTKCPETINFCIRDAPVRFVRKEGIKQFGKALSDIERWEPIWRAMGETQGMVDLLAKLSVEELKMLTSSIGRCNRGRHRPTAREEAVEELIYALLPSHYPSSKIKSYDKRPIQNHYARLVAACPWTFIERLLNDKDQSNVLYRDLPIGRLIKIHGERLRKRLLVGLFGTATQDEHVDLYLDAFIYREPMGPGPEPQVSKSMDFAVKLLQLRLKHIDDDKRWQWKDLEPKIVFSLLRRYCKRKLPESKTFDILELALQLLEAKPSLKPGFLGDLWFRIVHRWANKPDRYNDLVGRALRSGLGGSQKSIGQDYERISRAVPDMKWQLLQMFCLHVPQKPLRLETTTNLKPLANQPWACDIFFGIPRDHAVRLLKGLYDANPEYSFLQRQGRGANSILTNQDLISQRNFNVTLLLTILQHDSKECQDDARKAVDELRRKAATSREQSDRAHFAKAASDYAIASGNLDVYGETITWQQRFVRDPLTVKAIFRRDAVMTTEGIGLLSGIPHPLPKAMTLAEVATSVEKANKILVILHETMRIAKREPSFHQPDWHGVTSLFGAAVGERVNRAKDLQKRLQESEADFYTAIWTGTLAMLQKVGHVFLVEAYTPIRSLLDTLSPTLLAATAKALLEAGNEKRKKQDRDSGDDTLESLSYMALLGLAKSDKPELAQPLVLQTILDRPDASSWHRQLLSISFMKRLSAKHAHEMLLAFATAIGEKLEEQSYVKVGEAQPPQSAPPQSLVKVTTVKYLAQLLDNAEFISANAAVEVLIELFKAGTHRDIRLATLDSLLSLLNNICSGAEAWRSNELVEKILGALETVIPIVGSINERRPTRLEDWEEYKASGTLPAVSDIHAGLPPLLSAIISASADYRFPGLKKIQNEFTLRYLLPILTLSQEEHRQWTAAFLTKYKANFTEDDLPPTPVSPQLWEFLIDTYPESIPQAVFEDYNKHVIMTIAPSATLEVFNNSLRQDSNLRTRLEVKHWLSVFGGRADQYRTSGTRRFVTTMIRERLNASDEHSVSYNRLQEMILEHASLFLDDYEGYMDMWNAFITQLRHPTKSSWPSDDANAMRLKVSKWQERVRPLLEKVTTLVERRREKHTQERKHGLLPSTTSLRLWLLPCPCLPQSTEVDSQCEDLASKVVNVLDAVLHRGNNVLRWPKIVEDAFTISSSLNTDEERLRVAYHIGMLGRSGFNSDNQAASVMDLVKATLAMRLVEDGKALLRRHERGHISALAKELALRLRSMFEGWQNHDSEGVRENLAEWRRGQKDLWCIIMTQG